MMGGRGGIILSKKEYGKKIDSAVFPGCQGTSAVNLLAAKALIFQLATEENFLLTQKMTLRNAKIMAKAFIGKGYRIISNGTDNHQILVDLTSKNISGKIAENCLESVGIILNRNVVPDDAGSTGKISGIRIGSGAVSTRGMGEIQMRQIVELVDTSLVNHGKKQVLSEIKEDVLKLCQAFPIKKSI